MKITRINCYNFRNISKLDLKPAAGLNIFVGSNAQGKSNFLEAIYMFVAGRSYRTNRSSEVISFSQDKTEVHIELNKRESNFSLYLCIDENSKNLTIDGINRKKVADLLGYLNIVSFFPKDLVLISGGPKQRREFIDLEISQVIPGYYQICQQYQRLLKQRNMLLKNAWQHSFSDNILTTFNDQLIDLGSQIVMRRLETLYKLSMLAKLAHRQITDAEDNLTMNYNSEIGIADDITQVYKLNREAVEDLLSKRLQAVKEKEKERRVTLAGPHLDDIGFLINGHDVKRFGSQGQQRSTVLSLKLAELQYMRSETGEMPILLLDDVLSELDRKRQTLLLETAAGHTQTFVATTDISLLADSIIKRASIYQVKGGVFFQQQDL